MCGRTCLTLEKSEIQCACKYIPVTSSKSDDTKDANEQNSEDNSKVPEWRSEYNCGITYAPSYNIAPSEVTPVLVSSAHFSEGDEADESGNTRLIVPMLWGMIPFWHKGDYRKHGLTTNNCRLEHMLESKLYYGPFKRGQRCAVLCEGYYEWQTTKSAKPSERDVHLLYMPQKDSDIKIYDKSTWKPENVNLLKMAGIYDIWQDDNGDKIFSYSIITFQSTKVLSWLHHRMPAILETEQQLNDWLDFKRVPDEQALKLIRPVENIRWHRVSNIVNNSRHKSDQCNKPIELVQKTKKLPMNKTMQAWLDTRKRREEEIARSSQSTDDEDDAAGGSNTQGKGSGSADVDTTTTESEVDNPPKRPRYRDFKNSSRSNSANARKDKSPNETKK